MQTKLVYITAENKTDALALGKKLLEDRLVACINIIPAMNSMYWWQNQIEVSEEVIIIAKTSEERIHSLIEKVKEIHNYSCPCVVAWDVKEGNKDFLNWIIKETQQ